MSTPFGSFPFDAAGVDNYAHPLFINAFRPPTTNDIQPAGTTWQDSGTSPSTPTLYETTGGGRWLSGSNAQATTTVAGITRYATTAEVMAGTGTNNAALAADVFNLALSIVVGAVPAATETTAGIAEIATQVETDAGVNDVTIVTPLKLANFVASGGFPGVFTDLTATGTVSFTGATGGITMTSATASSFGTTGAGIDLTLDSASGRVVINGEEAAADAVRILSAAGGLDVNVALQMNLASSQNAADAIVINSSAGGIDITAAGAAGEDIDIVNTAGSINLNSGEAIATSMTLVSAGGLDVTATGAAGSDIDIVCTSGSINLTSGENVADSIVITSSLGGIQILAAGAGAAEDIVITATGSSVRLTSTENVTDAINIEATLGGVNILASGAAAGEDINITATGSSVNVNSTENAALAIYLHANGGTSETIQLHSDQGTGVASVNVLSDVGGITLRATGLASADAINLEAPAGGIDLDGALQINVASSQAAVDAIRIVASNAAGGLDLDSGTGGVTIDSTGAISIDGAAASNFSVTGAGIDLTLSSASGSVPIAAGEAIANAIGLQAAAGGIDVDGALQINIASSQAAAADSIRIIASAANGGMDIDSGTGGMTLDTTGALSLDSAAASNFTVTGAFDLTLNSTAGSLNLTAGESAADSMVFTNNGMDIVTSGAAGRDIDITNTGGSITITATENVTDALNLTASGAASRLNLTAGTGSVRILSGLVVPVTTKANADTPYTVLGTDYVINCDTSAGVLTVTLPAATALAGRTFVIRDGAGSAAVNNITIGGGGTNLVGGGAAAATKVLSAAYSGATVYSNGTVWLYAYVA